MGSKFDGPSGPRPRFFIVGLSHFQRGISNYTWLACKTDISEEVRSHQSNVISRLFVVPGPPTDLFRTTNSIAFKLHPINQTVTNRAAQNWFRAPKRFNLWLSEKFCLSQRMQESIDPKALITYMGSKIDGPSGPRPRFFIVGHSHFQRGIGHYTWLACKTDISEEVRSHQSNVISRLFVVPRPPTD